MKFSYLFAEFNIYSILGPTRSRKRKANIHRLGLTYLEEYDSKQNEMKRKELELEDRRLKLEERKIDIMERQVAIAEFEAKKKFELEQKKINFEEEQRKDLVKIIERQEKLIDFIISKNI